MIYFGSVTPNYDNWIGLALPIEVHGVILQYYSDNPDYDLISDLVYVRRSWNIAGQKIAERHQKVYPHETASLIQYPDMLPGLRESADLFELEFIKSNYKYPLQPQPSWFIQVSGIVNPDLPELIANRLTNP